MRRAAAIAVLVLIVNACSGFVPVEFGPDAFEGASTTIDDGGYGFWLQQAAFWCKKDQDTVREITDSAAVLKQAYRKCAGLSYEPVGTQWDQLMSELETQGGG